MRVLKAGRLNWGVKFVHREANNIAHKLAKLAFALLAEKVWIEEVFI